MGELARRLKQTQSGGGFSLGGASSADDDSPEGGGGMSPLGFLGNVAGDFKELGVGLTSLLAGAGKDVWNVGREAVTLGKADTDFVTDDLVKELGYNWEGQDAGGILSDLAGAVGNPTNLVTNERFAPAIKEDYSRRYGSVEGAKEGLYNDPLSYLLDVGMLGSVAGKTASTGARIASKTGSASDDLAALGRLARDGEVAGDVGRTARIVDKIHPGAKLQAIGEEAPLGGLTQRIDSGGRLTEVAGHTNPYTRARQNAWQRVTSRPVDDLQKDIDRLTGEIEDAPMGSLVSGKMGSRDLLMDVKRQAEDQGITRVTTPSFSKLEAGSIAKKIVNSHQAFMYSERNKIIRQHEEIFSRVPRGEAANLDHRLQGLSGTSASAPRRTFDEVTNDLSDPGLVASSPKAQEVNRVVGPHVERIRSMHSDLDWTDADAMKELDAAKRFVEIVAGEPLAGIRHGSDLIGNVMDDTRLLNLDAEASQLLDSGGTYRTLFERLYLPIRVREMMERGLKSIDEATDPFELDDVRRVGKIKAPVYYPQKSMLTMKNSDYLMKSSQSGMGRRSDPASFKKNRGTLMTEHLRGTKDAYETDPMEAYSRLAAEITGHRETARMIDSLKTTFGRKITAREELPEGWAVINPEYSKLGLRKSEKIRTEITRHILEGDDDGTAMAKAVDDAFVPSEDVAQLLAHRGEQFAVPQVVADKLNAMGKYSMGRGEPYVRVSVDAFTNVWRQSTLYFRPAYYMNQTVGNVVMANLGGGKLRNVIARKSKSYDRVVKNVEETLGVEDIMHAGFNKNQQMAVTHMGKAEDLKVGRAMKRLKGTRAVRAGSRVTRRGQDLANSLDEVFRTEVFMSAAEKDMVRRGVKLVGNKLIRSEKRLNQIMKHGIDNPNQVRSWVDEALDAMGDYWKQGPLERKIIRRFAMPFWAFYRHSSKVLLRMPFDSPGSAELARQIGGVWEEMAPELPEWLAGAAELGPGDQPGETLFLNPRAANPVGTVTEQSTNPLGSINPLAQMGLEQLLGRELYTGDKLSSPDVNTPFGSDQAYEMGPDGEPVPKDVRPSDADILGVPFASYVADMFPLVGDARDVAAGGTRYDTGELIEDERTGEARYPINPAVELTRFLGVPVQEFSAGSYAERTNREKQAALRQLLERVRP